MGQVFGSQAGHSYAPGHEFLAILRLDTSVLILLGLVGLALLWMAVGAVFRRRGYRPGPRLAAKPWVPPQSKPEPPGTNAAAGATPVDRPAPEDEEIAPPVRTFPRKAWEERLRRDIRGL